MRVDALSMFCSVLLVTVGSFFIGSVEALYGVWLALFIFALLHPATRHKLFQSLLLVLGVPLCLLIFHAVGTLITQEAQSNAALLSTEGMIIGVRAAGRVGISVTAALLFVWLADYRELFSGLVRMGLSYRLALTIYLALRYVPLMRFHRGQIRDAIRVRIQGSRISWYQALRLEMSYLLLLFVNGLRSADTTADAIILRGREDGSEKRVVLPHLRVGWGGISLILGSLTVVLFAVTR